MNHHKKTILMCVFISFTIYLSGCGSSTAVETNQISDSTIQSDSKNETIEKNVEFKTKSVSKEIHNSYGILIKFHFILPVLAGNYSGIEGINKYYIAKEKELLAKKDSDYLNSDGNKDPDFFYYLTAKYHFEAKLGDVISIVGDGDSYTGGVSNPEIIGDVFNLNSGKKLGLDDIFKIKSEEYLKLIIERVSQKIEEDIKNTKPGEGSGYNFEDPYSDGKKEISQYDVHNFYLTKNALVVFYPKYALAAGAAGPLRFELPFESILGVLAIDR